MKKMFCIIGKSCSGKNTIFSKLLKIKELNLKAYVTYTTRPKRKGEIDGIDYNFVSNDFFQDAIDNGKMIEYKDYNTVSGVWRYGSIRDKTFECNENIIVLCSLYQYLEYKNNLKDIILVPIYIYVEDNELLKRAILREESQEIPNYKEMCRRYISDTEQFSDENIKKAKINNIFVNNNLDECVNNIVKHINEFSSNN